jgi:hypothetical protein
MILKYRRARKWTIAAACLLVVVLAAASRDR